MRPSQGFGEEGNKGIYFRETGEQRPNFEGNRGTKTILGNREHKKKNSIFGEHGNKPIYFRGTREQVPPHGRASKVRNIFDSVMTVNIQAIYILVMHEGNQRHAI